MKLAGIDAEVIKMKGYRIRLVEISAGSLSITDNVENHKHEDKQI